MDEGSDGDRSYREGNRHGFRLYVCRTLAGPRRADVAPVHNKQLGACDDRKVGERITAQIPEGE